MNIQQIFDELESATDFELFRLKSAIEKVLEDPERTNALKRKIQVGMAVEYFCTERNKAVLCTVLKVGRSRVSVREQDTGQQWSLPFYFLNLDHVETTLVSSKAVGLFSFIYIHSLFHCRHKLCSIHRAQRVAREISECAICLVGNVTCILMDHLWVD